MVFRQIDSTLDIVGNILVDEATTSVTNYIPYGSIVDPISLNSYTTTQKFDLSQTVAQIITVTDNSYNINFQIVGRIGTNSMISNKTYHVNNTSDVLQVQLVSDQTSPAPFATLTSLTVGNVFLIESDVVHTS